MWWLRGRRDTSIGRPVASARASTNVALADIPRRPGELGMVSPVSASAASSRSAPRWAIPSSTARTISGRPVPRVMPTKVPRAPKSHTGVPMPEQGGDEPDVAGVVARAATSSDLGRGGDDAEIVA